MSKNILIIEDDVYCASLYKLHLEKAGYITQTATDGPTALKLADSFHPDLILLDLILPKIDGFVLLHFFKKTPVIIISNLAQSTEIDKCKELGAKLFISKDSVDYVHLINQINKLIG